MSEPKTYESYKQLADDILTGKYCKDNLPNNYKRDILARMLVDVFWDGWDSHATDTYGEKGV